MNPFEPLTRVIDTTAELTHEQFEEIRRKVLMGEQVPLEEYRKALNYLRQRRMSAAAAATTAKNRAPGSRRSTKALDIAAAERALEEALGS